MNVFADCKVSVTTSSEADSGTDAKVILTVIGQDGQSEPCPLIKEDKKPLFVPGETELFDVRSLDIYVYITCKLFYKLKSFDGIYYMVINDPCITLVQALLTQCSSEFYLWVTM